MTNKNNNPERKSIISNEIKNRDQGSDVEVITIWYNRSELVKNSIKSIIDQTFSNYRILAVDDGSTDDTGDKLEEMLDLATKEQVPMRVWRKENEGFTTSIKRAIEEHSNAEIVAVHGAGDISLSERLQTQFDLLESRSDLVVVGAKTQKMAPDGTVIGQTDPSEIPEADLENNSPPWPGTHGETMYYRKSYDSVGGYRKQFPIAQDVDLWLRLSEVGEFQTVQKILYKQVQTKSSVSKSDYNTRLNQIICFAAAVESARCRSRGLEDPIDTISGTDINALEKVAKMNGLNNRAVKRLCYLAGGCLLSGNIKGAISVIETLEYEGLLKSVKFMPELSAKTISRFISL